MPNERLGNMGAVIIANGVSCSTHVLRVNLGLICEIIHVGFNRIGAEGAEAIGAALVDQKSLRVLSLGT